MVTERRGGPGVVTIGYWERLLDITNTRFHTRLAPSQL